MGDSEVAANIISESSANLDAQKPSADGPDLPSLLRSVTDRALTFLSNADNGTLGACLVGLGATTYIVLGRVGLVLIGVAGGVVLHATWEGSQGGAKTEEVNRRRETGIEVARRLLDWHQKKSSDDASPLLPSDIDDDTIKTSDFSSYKPETAQALNELTDAIVRDYIRWWYSPILPADLAFPAACRQTLASFISSLSLNLSRKRPADTFLEFATNSSSVIIVILNELTTALSASPGSSAENALQTYLRLKPQSNLANILDAKHQQRKLKMVADDILENYLEPSVYRCTPNRIFLREILANVILEMTIQTCSQADWINEWIVYLLEAGEPELMKEIDAGVEGVTPQGLGIKKEVRIQDDANGNDKVGGSKPTGDHKRRVSRAEEAMDEAMREAQRLTQMIVEEEERKAREEQEQEQEPNQEQGNKQEQAPKEQQEPLQSDQSQTNLSEVSEGTSNNVHTPTSSQSEASGEPPQQEFPQPPSRPLSNGPASLQSSPSQERSPPMQYQPLPVVDETAPLATVPAELAEEASKPRSSEPLTLLGAKISILDDLLQGDKRPLKSKPVVDYLIQIEPASSSFSGWMIARTYNDFEVLHEVLRRISNISGCDFTKSHAEMPAWKGISKAYLKDELERYLTDAVTYSPLAESEGMKRFLERERGLQKLPPSKSGFWPNPANVGKGMLDALAKAPKEVAGGSKALLGNVQNAFVSNQAGKGSPTLSHPNRGASMSSTDLRDQQPITTPNRYSMVQENPKLSRSGTGSPRPSLDSRSSSYVSQKTGSSAPRPASQRGGSIGGENLMNKLDISLATVDQPRRRSETPEMTLPPRPDQIPDDYNYASPRSATSANLVIPEHVSHMSVDGTSFFEVPTQSPSQSPNPATSPVERHPRPGKVRQSPGKPSPGKPAPSQTRPQRIKQPLAEQEAQVTVELLFAVITELYQLSSAWNIRRTLLTAAKTFLLRPGNPQLESIRVLLQESVLDANTSDAGIAAHISKLRENSMPTDEERARWPPAKTDREREELRQKARKLLVQRGMPQALTSVMGAAASGEALGKVFDCLQVTEVARGVMFGLMLQLVRAVTQ